MKIKPLNDRVLVLRGDKEQKSADGIIIPDIAKEKPQQGKIVAVLISFHPAQPVPPTNFNPS